MKVLLDPSEAETKSGRSPSNGYSSHTIWGVTVRPPPIWVVAKGHPSVQSRNWKCDRSQFVCLRYRHNDRSAFVKLNPTRPV